MIVRSQNVSPTMHVESPQSNVLPALVPPPPAPPWWPPIPPAAVPPTSPLAFNPPVPLVTPVAKRPCPALPLSPPFPNSPPAPRAFSTSAAHAPAPTPDSSSAANQRGAPLPHQLVFDIRMRLDKQPPYRDTRATDFVQIQISRFRTLQLGTTLCHSAPGSLGIGNRRFRTGSIRFAEPRLQAGTWDRRAAH